MSSEAVVSTATQKLLCTIRPKSKQSVKMVTNTFDAFMAFTRAQALDTHALGTAMLTLPSTF